MYKDVIKDVAETVVQQLWQEVEYCEPLQFEVLLKPVYNGSTTQHNGPIESTGAPDAEGADSDACVAEDSESGHVMSPGHECDPLGDAEGEIHENPDADIMLQVAQHKFMYT